ncbi:MAG: class B sortase [Eubacterium sp.]
MNYKEDEKKYAQINQMFIKDNEEKTTEKSQDNKSIRYTKSVSTWKWDYKEMLQYNDEAKGYIKLNGTRIQYPIVEHSDNDFYLKRGSDKVYNGAGAIFLDYRTAGLDGKMCILYGHNMLDGSMFKELMNFRDDDFCRKHPTFDIYVGYRHYIYYVFSVFSDKDDNENIYKYGFANDGEFQNWINTVSSRSRYNFGVRKPDTSDKIIMCSTCVDDYGNRQIVCLYRGEEVVD